MNPITAFGVGCFHLAVRLKPPYRFRPSSYAEIIESLLGKLDTVGRFSVSPSTMASSDELKLGDGALSMLHEGVWLPGYIDAVEFSLRIPRRVQDDIVRAIHGKNYSWTGLGTEHFMVRTRYFYDAPVTIVECLDLDDDECEDPSDAVVVVREFLKQKLKESEADIDLEVVGPSPFHADFFVFDETEEVRPHVEHTETGGYDRVIAYVPPHIRENHADWVLEWMGPKLSFYYHLKRINIWQARQWGDVNRAWHSLNEPAGSETWAGRAKALMKKRRAIASLVDGVLMFQAGMLSRRQRAYSAKENNRSERGLEFLDEKIDRTFEDTFRTYPTAQVLELAKFYETRDSKRRDRVHVLVAALMGGAIGAILSQLLGGT